MAKSVFEAPQFKTEEGAFAYVEAHLWPHGPVCPHCGNADQARIRKMQGKTTQAQTVFGTAKRIATAVRLDDIVRGAEAEFQQSILSGDTARGAALPGAPPVPPAPTDSTKKPGAKPPKR